MTAKPPKKRKPVENPKCYICGDTGQVPMGYNDMTVDSRRNLWQTKPCPKCNKVKDK